MVGKCQLITVLQVVENVDSPDCCLLLKWHIHIGTKDFEALQQNAWDSDICYLSANVKLGEQPTDAICNKAFWKALRVLLSCLVDIAVFGQARRG